MRDTVELDNGKYEVVLENIQHNGAHKQVFKALRNGQEWRDLVGDGLIMEMFYRILELEEELDED